MDVEGDRDMGAGATADVKAGEELQQGLKVQYDAASHPISLSSPIVYVLLSLVQRQKQGATPAGQDAPSIAPAHAAEVMEFVNRQVAESRSKQQFSKKKIRDLMQLSAPAFQAYKLNAVIADCCKVGPVGTH
jgi:hypothetical protein